MSRDNRPQTKRNRNKAVVVAGSNGIALAAHRNLVQRNIGRVDDGVDKQKSDFIEELVRRKYGRGGVAS